MVLLQSDTVIAFIVRYSNSFHNGCSFKSVKFVTIKDVFKKCHA